MSTVPAPASLAPALREPLAGLLLAMADDEFVLGYWDSEWTGIAPMLEEDVAFSSLAQDEIGHAQAFLQLRAELSGEDPDAVAYGREPADFRHARLLDHGRGDWAFSIARRHLYETADALRLEALAGSTHAPLAELVAKVRREERYHLMHVGSWFVRLAEAGGEARRRLEAALARLAPDAATVFTPLPGETALVEAGLMAAGNAHLAGRWQALLEPELARLRLPMPRWEPPADGRHGHEASEDFRWLHGEFTLVARSEAGVTW
ncbi:MAG TPA: 1,2-phenylacetyl-CoA epoxidase subunit PaaC [Candidatus Limnocylindrales bacterium]|nr:1,2-phenylacetyl-CoA epoxidase subunit PaaC [Candidatus Limnocylindrales bacterium]